MAVFFNGAFTRELRREAERRLRRDTIEKAHAHLGVHPFSARSLFSGLGTRRVLQGRSKTQALSEPRSQRIGQRGNNYSSPGNQSRSSVYRGRDTQKKRQPTSGTQPSGSTGPTRSSFSASPTQPTRGTTARNFHSGSSNAKTFDPQSRSVQGIRQGGSINRHKRQARFHSVVS